MLQIYFFHASIEVMERKPQQQTLSVRISEGLRTYLERAREVVAGARGETVSTSDVAKMLLELAKGDRLDDRLEVAQVMQQPTEALISIRQKWEHKTTLSRAEWIVLADYVQKGCESAPDDPELPRPESFGRLLEAFLAARALRVEQESNLDDYYLGNLGPRAESSKKGQSKSALLSETAKALIQELRQPDSTTRPIFAGRNLYVALRDEHLQDIAAVNRALLPFMPSLYALAARGHWLEEHRPVRPRRAVKDYGSPLSVIPAVVVGDFRLSLAVAEEELAVALEMPSRDVTYPLEPYPKIREFATMLARLQPAGYWKGREFFGYTDALVPNQVRRFYFRHRINGVTFGFSQEEWSTLKEMFAKAFALAELKPTLAELSLQYGEV